MDIVTGHKGEPHITPESDAGLNRGLVGMEEYVLPVGTNFNADLVSNNLIKIGDGELVMQGRHAQNKQGVTEELEITNGSQGEKRIDLVVARYTFDSETQIDNVELVIVQGASTTGTPSEPELQKGDIRAGATLNEMPLYKLELNGIVVEKVTPVFNLLLSGEQVKSSLMEQNRRITELNASLTTKKTFSHDSGYTKRVSFKLQQGQAMFAATNFGDLYLISRVSSGISITEIIKKSGTTVSLIPYTDYIAFRHNDTTTNIRAIVWSDKDFQVGVW